MNIMSKLRILLPIPVFLSLALPVPAQVMEEIVVTARKQNENLTEVPVAVSVMTEDFFDKSGFNTFTDVVRFVPGFDYSPTNTTRANGTRIRGISTFSFSDGFESSVATVIDGVVMGREAQGFFDLYDIQSVEVIKGPQGTLFGKNASAGVVNVITKKPEYEFFAGGDATFGTYGERRFRGSVTGPLIDNTLAYRITGSINENDGLIENKFAGEDDVNSKDTWSLRAKFLYEPTDELSALLTIDTVEEDNACCLATYLTSGPDLFLITAAGSDNNLQLADALAQAGITPGPGNRSVAILDDRINQESDSSGIALEVNYDLAGAQLTSITAWRDWSIDEFNEADQLSIADINNRNGTEADSEQVSQEIRLHGNIGDSMSYVTGLFYFDEEINADGSVYVELASFDIFNSRTRVVRTADTTSMAAFGELTWDISDKFRLIVGGRYTDEEKEATYVRGGTAIDPAFGYSVLFGGEFSGEQKVDDTDFSGRVIARYNIAENVNTYLTWSRGYKGAGIDVAETVNADVIAEPGGLPVVEPEVPTLVELGFKGWFLNSSLSVNTAIFHQSVEGLQAIVIGTAGQGTVENLSIGEIVSDGIEMDITYLPPVDGLTLTGSVTWLDVKYEKYDQRPELEGEDYQGVPEWAVSFIGDYSFELGDTGWNSFVRAEYYWQDEKNSRSSGEESSSVDAYGLLNLRAGATSPNDTYSVTLAVENATDEDYPYFIGGSSYSSLGSTSTSQYLGPDRIVRLTLGAEF